MDEIMENPGLETEETFEPAGEGGVVPAQEEEQSGGLSESLDWSEGERRAAGRPRDQPETEGKRADDQPNAELDSSVAEKPQQSHQDNAAARAARKRAEQETTERLRKQYDQEVAGLGLTNPYTGKPFQSFKEFREYGKHFKAEQMLKKAKSTGKSIAELQEEEEAKSLIAQKREQERQQREAMEALKAKKDFVSRDLDEFMARFPNVDPGKLEANSKFRKFAGKRLYKEPLAELYSDFVELVSDAERAAVEKAAGKARRSTGGGQEGGKELLTPAQRAALMEWNRDNPDMKMSAKEFLSR